MGIATYDDIVSFVTDHLQLDTDTVAQLPNIIRMAELDLNRLILAPEREKVCTAVTTAPTQTVGLPSGFRQAVQVMLDDDYPLEQVTLNVLQGGYANNGATGKPKVFAIADSAIYLGPIPDAEYTLTLTYIADLTPISSSNQTNVLTDSNPDAYVYAVLAQAEAFRANIAAADMWNAKMLAVVDDINRQGVRFRNSMPIRLQSPVVI